MMHEKFKYLMRAAMLAFWVIIIIVVLYIPSCHYGVHHEKTLSIATWPLLIDPQIVQKFEQETGIKVQIAYFERSEELFAKILATGGKGYDIIFPSDHTVKLLINHKLLAPIDHTKLQFWHDLDDRLLNNYYDPENQYSIPFYWGVIGLGINKKFFPTTPPQSWALVFDKKFRSLPLLMTDQAREAILAAAQYLYGSVDALQEPQARMAVKDLLIQQKKWVTMYSTERVDDMLVSGNCAIAFGMASDIMRARVHSKDVELIIPQEGTFLVIDAITLTLDAQQDLAYQFINYLYRSEVMLHHMEIYAMCPPLKSLNMRSGCLNGDFGHLNFLTNVLPEEEFNTIWIDLLAH